MKVKNKSIVIGNVLSEHTFVSGTKYWRIDKATFEGEVFEVGTRVSWVDPDEERYTEYTGCIEWLMVDDRGNVEVSIDNILVGRLSLDELVVLHV